MAAMALGVLLTALTLVRQADAHQQPAHQALRADVRDHQPGAPHEDEDRGR